MQLDELMVEAVAMFGCSVPSTEFVASRVAESISKFIVEHGYGDLSSEEIVLAMRLNATGQLHHEGDVVPFFGNTLNITFLAAVLARYMTIRNIVDGRLKNKIDGYDH